MIYTAENVSKKKTLEFFKKCTCGDYSEIHSIKMYQGDRLVLDVEIPPYTHKQVSQIYSLSKSFTSTAIGMLYDDGRININDRVIDIIEWNGKTNEKIEALTVHNLLSMSSGHGACSMPAIACSDDGVKAFFEQEFTYMPGTDFSYDTGATYMLSAIVTKITGMTMFDYLYEKLWKPLDITSCSWQTAGGKINEGGIGLFISTEDLAKLAVLYLNKGIYNGKRILSEEWINMASSKWVDNVFNGTINWRVGYGYQMWMNACGGYRGDGAFGQYCIIHPEKNIALVALTESANMEKQMDDIFEYIMDFEADGSEEDFDLDAFINSRYLPACGGELNIDSIYELKENIHGFTRCHVKGTGNMVEFAISDGTSIQTVRAGNGEWIENEIYARDFKPLLKKIVKEGRTESAKFFASFKVLTDNKIMLDIRYVNCPHHMHAEAEFNKKLLIKLTYYKEGVIRDGAECIEGIMNQETKLL